MLLLVYTTFYCKGGKTHTTTWVDCCLEAIKVLSHNGIKDVKISLTVIDLYAELRVSNKFKFPCENRKKIPLFLDYNQDVSDELLLYGKKTMGYTNFLDAMFH